MEILSLVMVLKWVRFRCLGSVASFCSLLLALIWFKDHFLKCNDRAELVKTWLPVSYDGPKSWLDQLVYDRALLLVGALSSTFLRVLNLF
jgi:hypothetical protein